MAFDPNAPFEVVGGFDPSKPFEVVEPRTTGEAIKDTAIDVAKGVVGLGESVVGIADIATGNAAGKGLSAIGYDPQKTSDVLSSGYSKPRQFANEQVSSANGFMETLGALVDNPSVAFGAIVESAPMSLAGAAAARVAAVRMLSANGIKAGTTAATKFFADPKVQSALVRVGAATEGAQTAGSIQESGRQAGKEWQDTVAPALAAGAGTAAIGVASSKIPGFRDAEATVASAGLGAERLGGNLLASGKEIAKSMFKEGWLEELPQSMQEQIFTNLAMDKPWDEGVGAAGAQGAVAGMGQGGGMTAASELTNGLTRVTESPVSSNIQQEPIAPVAEPQDLGPAFPPPEKPKGPLATIASNIMDRQATTAALDAEALYGQYDPELPAQVSEFTDASFPPAEQPTAIDLPAGVDPETGEILPQQAETQDLPVPDDRQVSMRGRPYRSEVFKKEEKAQSALANRLISRIVPGSKEYAVKPVKGGFQIHEVGEKQAPDKSGMSFPEVLQGLERTIPRESQRVKEGEDYVEPATDERFNPGWFRDSQIKRFDAENGTAHAGKILPLKVMSTLRSYLNGRQLNETQRPAWDFIKDYAAKEYGVEVPEFGAVKVFSGAHEAATSPLNGTPQPTEAQKKVGNYKVGRARIHGMDISIENPAGSERSGTDKSGKAWSIPMQDHYGYIKGTVGNDKDHIDAFINPANPESNKVFVVDQVDPGTGAFDEHKVLMGFNSEDEARAGYLRNYEPGWQGLGAITEMPVDQFKEWTKSGKTKQPLAIKAAQGQPGESAIIPKMSDLTPDPAHVAEGMDNPDTALDHFENAIPQEDRAVMANVFANIRKNGLHRQTSFAQQLFNMVGGIYFRRTGKQLAILGGNADNISKEAHHELTTETGRAPGITSDSRDGIGGASKGSGGGVESTGDGTGAGPARAKQSAVTNNPPEASAPHETPAKKSVGASSGAGGGPPDPNASDQSNQTADSPAIEPLGGKSILVKGDIPTLRTKLKDASFAPTGLPNTKRGGLVFAKKHEAAIRKALVTEAHKMEVGDDTVAEKYEGKLVRKASKEDYKYGYGEYRNDKIKKLEIKHGVPGHKIVFKAFGLMGPGFYYQKDNAEARPAPEPSVSKSAANETQAGLSSKSETQKEPWEMTKAEYVQSRIDYRTTGAGAHKNKVSMPALQRNAAASHEMYVEDAISEGKPVPAEVLADYPDLAKDVAWHRLGDSLDWRDFQGILLGMEITDSFGKVGDQEKKQWSAAGESWKLVAVDPNTLAPVELDAPTNNPIVVAHGDVLDGRNRRQEAINKEKPAIAAWVASDEKTAPTEKTKEALNAKTDKDDTLATVSKDNPNLIKRGKEWAVRAVQSATPESVLDRAMQKVEGLKDKGEHSADGKLTRAAQFWESARVTAQGAVDDGNGTTVARDEAKAARQDAINEKDTKKHARAKARSEKTKQDQSPDFNEQKTTNAPHELSTQDDMTGDKQGDIGQEKRENPDIKIDLAFHDETMRRIHDGTATLAEYKAGFQRVVGSKEELTAEFSKMTKDQLIDRIGGYYRSKSDKKDALVRSAYKDMLTDFWVQPGMFSYGMDGIEPAIVKAVNEATESDLKTFSERVAAKRKERRAMAAQMVEAVKDPKTLDDFITYIRAKKAEGKTFAEARMSMSQEQQATFDELSALKSRKERGSRKEEDRTRVRAAGATTGAEIIATKHTRDGYDLFVVQAEERVEREVYNEWNATAKKMGGWYSKFRGNGAVPGFQFKTREAAEAFQKYVSKGDTEGVKEQAQARRDAYADDRSQTAVERLTEMADKLEESADESLGQDRKANTSRRAGMAARAEANANDAKAMAKTMRNIASAIQDGSAQFLDRVRQKVQVSELASIVGVANYAKLRAQYPDYGTFEKHKHDRPTGETADHIEFPSYTAYRSDLAKLGRQLLEQDGTKILGQRLTKVANDITDAYLTFAKENLHKVSSFTTKDGALAVLPTKARAEQAIQRGGFRGQATTVSFKRGEHLIIISPEVAREKGLWNGDDDKRITLSQEIGAEIVEKAGKRLDVPWHFVTAHDRIKRLAGMGIETPAELRAAAREYIGLREAPKAADKVKELERAMVGRKNDGMDFFPTPEATADEMVQTAGIEPGMKVLEPSAGWGHIAERIRAAGVEPDVVEMSSDRQELLEAKGFNVVGRDFMETEGQYDRIIMNPPFSDRRDAEHVKHAYSLLNPGGRVVAIMGEGVFFGQDKKAKAFREWLESVGGTSEKLEQGTFLDPSLPVNTGVNSRMVVIEKAGVSPLYSKTTTPSGTTTVQVKTELRTFLKRGYDKLTASGKLRVVQSVAELPENMAGAENLYSKRESAPPKKTVTAYKLFRVKSGQPGKLFPLFVDANAPLDMGVWYDADSGERTDAGKVKSKLGPLAYRPGWHAGDVPVASHIGIKANPKDAKPSFRNPDFVWAEVELADDVDWQEKADAVARRKADGSIIRSTAAITDAVPVNGHYRYKTNPNMTGEWLISGAMKVTRVLTDEQVLAINEEKGVSDLPRTEAQDITDFGFTPLYSKDGSIAGTYDPKTGQITLVSDNIKPGGAEYVMLHEGLHSLMREDALFAKQHDAILDQFEKLKATDYRVQDAYRRVPSDTAADLVREEALAYFVQEKANHETSLFKKIMANIRMWLMRMGIPMKNLTTDDLVAMVTQGVRRMADQGEADELVVGGMALASSNQTRTDAFQKWFGDSKVVDKNGEPLVVYHGTDKDIAEFDTGEVGEADKKRLGSYFSANKKFADLYGGNTVAAYLSMSNPLDITGMDAGSVIDLFPIPTRAKQELRSAFKGQDYTQYGLIEAAQRFGLRSSLKDGGADGIKYTEGYADAFVVFSPNQIKSATGNSGEFSATNNDIRYTKTSPMSLENLEETARTMGSITVKKRAKVDSTMLDRIFSTPEYYFKKFAAAGRVLKAALDRRDVRFTAEQKILGKDFVGYVQALRKNNKEAYAEANEYLVGLDQSSEGFSLKEEDETWKVIGPDGKMVSRHDTEALAVAAMVEAESAQLEKNGYSKDAIQAVRLARELTNRGFDVMAEDMRKIIAEAKEAGLPNPLIGDGTLDEAGRYGIYGAHSKKPIALFATEQQATEAMRRAAEMISYVVQIQGGGERSFMSPIKANAWAKKHSGTVNGRKTFGGLSVRMRTDVEMRPMTVQQALAQMGDMRGTYFPRIRKPGEYTLIAKKDGHNPIRKSFDLPMVGDDKNPTLQKIINMGTPMGREATKLKAQGYDVTMGYDESPVDDVFSGTNIATAIDAILQDSMSVIDKNSQGDIKAGQQINQLITMSVADIFKARGYLSSRLKRMTGDTVWEGYETDMGKALTQYGKGIAAGTAKRDTARAMVMAFSGRDYSWENYKQEVSKPVWSDYQEIVEERRIDPRRQKNLFTDVRSFMIDILRNDEQTDRIIGTMKGLAVLKFLGFRVSSAAVNATNMVTGVPATMAGHVGISLMKAGGYVAKAASAYGKYRTGKGEISESDKAIFQEITARGWDDAQFNSEAARELRSELGEAWNKMMTASMFMFGAVEKANRATTLFAAYKAVQEKNPSMSESMIWEKAKAVSDNAHGVYGKETVPAWVRGKYNFLRLPYTFSKFSHNYMLNMIDLGYTRGEYKAAAYLLLSPAVLAGAGATVATPVIMALASALGIGGDDPEEEYYAWAKKTFGTDSFSRHGLAGGLLGVNLKGSLQVNNPMPTKLSELGGAPGAILTDTWKAIQHFGRGEVAKGTEALLPTGFGSMSKAVREGSEGITTGSYGQVFHGNEPLKADGLDMALRFFSFNPSRISGIREKQWNEKEVLTKYQERKKDIYAQIKRLHLQGKGITPEVNKEIVRYNDLVKGSGRSDIKPITPKNIRLMLKLNNRASKFERGRAVNE